MIEGGCFCGAIGYRIDGDGHLIANCHCSMCRKTSGAPFVTWMIVPRDAFRYVRGRPAVLNSSDRGTRFFCDQCGTPLVFQSESRKEVVDVTTGSMTDPGNHAPTVAVHEESKLPWLDVTEVSSGKTKPAQRPPRDKKRRSDAASETD